MKKILLSVIVTLISVYTYAQCPSYSATPSSSNVACANQPLYFSVPNTNCPGTISFTVTGNSGSTWGLEISWEVVNIQTGTVVATGGALPGPPTSVGSGGTPYGNNATINVPVGPLSANTYGPSFMLYVYDSDGDGFNGAGGNITINGVTPAVSITGNFGDQTNQGFSAPVAVGDVNFSITTSAGTQTGVLSGCADFDRTLTLSNPSHCNTRTETVSWTLTCASTGAVLSSGSQNITVYPSLPTQASDLVSITWDATNCEYDVTPVECNSGTVYTISPDPSTLPPYSANGSQTFTVTYNGISGGPNCCATGGPLVPITFTTGAPSSSAVATNSPFNTPAQAPANAAFLTTGPSGVGGIATSGGFSVVISGYTFPDPPGTVTNTSYWVTIYVDGVVISDTQTLNPGPANTTVNITLAQIAAAGVTFDEDSVITAYVYPNTFNGGTPTQYTTFVLGGPANDPGEWTANVSISTVNFTFTEQQPSAANCSFTTNVNYTSCCEISAAVSNVVCNNNGTATTTDDTFTFTLTVTDVGGAGTTWSGNGQSNMAYGTPVTMGPYPISGGNIAISVADDASATCTATDTATAPAPCSSCSISTTVSNVVCNDNGTVVDTDDTYTFTLLVNSVSGITTTWSGNGQSNMAYGTPVTMGPYTISGGNIAISVTDDATPSCTATDSATAPAPCSVCNANSGTFPGN